ncbi:Dihydropteroate synthase [Lentinus tigrinus ALCF2SS1-7]|uniref:Dihydropteroate synthase n=1 Tax=Lentinus tigrinus ALCF2SS1-6 TaxID=1328759 RepID=A0A5C2SEV1_9APHY|nr:Dihydropteroate synthase [Lentinus tigrinus ALCF2SS1-6]RPD76024.1 Dihydropteroate synthase [Lentinus tigrinus ALCF2SS1-7]
MSTQTKDAVSEQTRDYVRVNDLALTVSFSDGSRWPSSTPQAQPVVLSFSFAHDVSQAAATDDLAHSVNYSTLASGMGAIVAAETFPSLEAFVDRVCDVYAAQYPAIRLFTVRTSRTKTLLYGAAYGLEITKLKSQTQPEEETFFFKEIVGHAIIGIHPHERQRKQRIRVDVSITRAFSRGGPLDFRTLEQRIFDFVEDSKFLTVEALASEAAHTILSFLDDKTASSTVHISKPSAILGAGSAEVEVTRKLEDFTTPSLTTSSTGSTTPVPSLATPGADAAAPSKSLPHLAAIAIGANIGDRFANIECALRLLEAPGADLEKWTGSPRVVVVNTSFLYETAPMYVEKQPKFINCACMVETDLEPCALLAFLKTIETAVGRRETFRNGPRAIDLDIVTYDSIVLDTRPEALRDGLDDLQGELVIPHPRLTEREFVLRPLADMIPGYVVPSVGHTVESLLSVMVQQPTDEPAMYKVIPFPRYPIQHIGEQSPYMSKIPRVPPTATYWTYPATSHPSKGKQPQRRTYIMATLNATPDSFSDGSSHYSLPDALRYATSAVGNGASIIDIGGYSTRPGAAFVSPEEEFTRVVPVVQAIREEGQRLTPTVSGRLSLLARTATTLISIDTFRWEVAEESVHAGANCINDVCAFSGPDWPPTEESEAHFMKMRQVTRDLAVPVVLMHSRGPAAENKDYSQYAYSNDERGRGAVLEGVRVELGAKVEKAIKGPGGVRRWLVIVDPGIGFSKTLEGNMEVLRECSSVVADYSLRLQDIPGAPKSRPKRNPLAGYPLLIGASRKSFLGAILRQPDKDETGSYEGRDTRPDERDWATAAAVSCAVQQGASVVRVHDVLHLGDAVRVSSALWS